MKSIRGWIALFALATAAQADWQLVWSDEFDGPAVDTTKWSFMLGDGTSYGLPAGWGNNELQVYQSSNATIVNGALRIRAENTGGGNYTSARLRTLNKAEFRYGRIEARMQLPSGAGLWPAFWMLPTNSPYGGWAASGEIDIMESVNIADRIYGTLHFGDQWPNNAHSGGELANGTDFSAGYHVYTIEWEPDQIRWYVDGNLYSTKNSNQWFSAADPGNARAPFDHDFHLLLNLAVGGNFPGPPNGSTPFPADFLIDWVRVYEDIPVPQTPFHGTPLRVPGPIEAEDFDLGGQNNAYNDCDSGNVGGEYRTTEDVDIEVSSEGGYNVGWLCGGEWLEYTVDVVRDDLYRIDARVASQASGDTFTLSFDGVAVPGTVTVPSTGGWQSYITLTTLASLTTGEQIFRFDVGGTGGPFNITRFDIWYAADLDRNGTVDISDLAIVLADFGSTCGTCPGDVDRDGDTDLSDLARVLASFGAS